MEFRHTPREQERINNILSLIPEDASSILDVGARDGYISLRLASRFDSVTALDLVKPNIQHEKIISVKGDISQLTFPDNSFDVVLCAEVLEHIIPSQLVNACQELFRVSRKYTVIGVPYKQDLRVGRTTCGNCGAKNPPWGHLNAFDEKQLENLFPHAQLFRCNFAGVTKDKTNSLSTLLLDLAGNPYGTYSQEEPCVNCGEKVKATLPGGSIAYLCAKTAVLVNRIQSCFFQPTPNWIHVVFSKDS